MPSDDEDTSYLPLLSGSPRHEHDDESAEFPLRSAKAKVMSRRYGGGGDGRGGRGESQGERMVTALPVLEPRRAVLPPAMVEKKKERRGLWGLGRKKSMVG